MPKFVAEFSNGESVELSADSDGKPVLQFSDCPEDIEPFSVSNLPTPRDEIERKCVVHAMPNHPR